MEELKTFLMKSDRYDLLAVLQTLLDEIDYSDDSDYEPPILNKEPIEEYLAAGLNSEEEYEVHVDEEGFLSIT
jgi:hypothetical protein